MTVSNLRPIYMTHLIENIKNTIAEETAAHNAWKTICAVIAQEEGKTITKHFCTKLQVALGLATAPVIKHKSGRWEFYYLQIPGIESSFNLGYTEQNDGKLRLAAFKEHSQWGEAAGKRAEKLEQLLTQQDQLSEMVLEWNATIEKLQSINMWAKKYPFPVAYLGGFEI